MRLRFAAMLVTIAVGALVLSSCEKDCDAALIDRAAKFVEAHQSCETNDDCVIVSDMCQAIPGGFCGQLPMNRAAAHSAEWNEIMSEFDNCGPDSCEQCLAVFTATCNEGSCRGPQR